MCPCNTQQIQHSFHESLRRNLVFFDNSPASDKIVSNTGKRSAASAFTSLVRSDNGDSNCGGSVSRVTGYLLIHPSVLQSHFLEDLQEWVQATFEDAIHGVSSLYFGTLQKFFSQLGQGGIDVRMALDWKSRIESNGYSET